jgi:hypothetical protein
LANLSGWAAAVAVTLSLASCGGGERRDAGVPDGTFTVAVERATFAPRQRLAQRNALVLRVRNAGEETIPNLVVTVRGFKDQLAGARNADSGRDLWIVDREPAGTTTTFADTWTAGRLKPGATTELRWEVTPAVAGRHRLTYEIAPSIAGAGRAELAGGAAPRGALTVQVTDKPAKSRVDPRTGEVLRDE